MFRLCVATLFVILPVVLSQTHSKIPFPPMAGAGPAGVVGQGFPGGFPNYPYPIYPGYPPYPVGVGAGVQVPGVNAGAGAGLGGGLGAGLGSGLGGPGAGAGVGAGVGAGAGFPYRF